MKCPKCHYLSFEPESRCRNCGYDFAFAQEDLMMKTGDEPEGPMTDIPLRPPVSDSAKATPITLGPIRPVSAPRAVAVESEPPASRVASASASSAAVAERPSVAANPAPPRREVPRRPPPPRPIMTASPQAPAPVVRRPVPAAHAHPPAVSQPVAPPASAASTAVAPPAVAPIPPAPPRIVSAPAMPAAAKAPISVELPLFVKGTPKTEDRSAPEPEAVVAVPAAPPPLAVRRRTPDPAKIQATYQREAPSVRKPGPVERDLLEDLQRLEQAPAAAQAPAIAATHVDQPDAVLPSARATAAGVDLLMLGAINAAIVWLTLRWCELSFGSIGVLPLFPLAAFLLLVNAGYLLLFTAANGQTVGKMVTGLRVVDVSEDDVPRRVGAGQAALRAICSVASVLALGAGFVPALFGGGRAFHDRIAHTRVVRV